MRQERQEISHFLYFSIRHKLNWRPTVFTFYLSFSGCERKLVFIYLYITTQTHASQSSICFQSAFKLNDYWRNKRNDPRKVNWNWNWIERDRSANNKTSPLSFSNLIYFFCSAWEYSQVHHVDQIGIIQSSKGFRTNILPSGWYWEIGK